jgi:hypothetical protein
VGHNPPEPGTADVGNARAELVDEQPKNAEDHVGVCAGIGHDFGRLKRFWCKLEKLALWR